MIGDVLFFKKTNSLISRMIASVTKSEYTHVALIIDYDKKTNIATIIESDRFIKTRVRKIQIDNNHIIYTTGIKPKEQVNKIVKFASQSIGMEYDYLQILGLFLALTFKGDRYSYFNSKNKLICSELIDMSYFSSGVKRKNNENIGNVTPSELLECYEFRRT